MSNKKSTKSVARKVVEGYVLSSADKKAILKLHKQGLSARPIGKTLSVPYRKVMAYLEEQGLAKFAESSYL